MSGGIIILGGNIIVCGKNIRWGAIGRGRKKLSSMKIPVADASAAANINNITKMNIIVATFLIGLPSFALNS